MTTLATLIMYGVAGIAAILAALVLTRRAETEPAVYRHRIAGAMLGALALILVVFATTFRLAQN